MAGARRGSPGRGGGGAGKGKPERVPAATRLPPPSSSAWAALGPYARTRLTVHALGRSLQLDVPGDVFSTQRIDEGTQLLLGHLPARAPASLLDLGCGYGALSLPVAARFPETRALLVDRDLLAVRASAHNARALGLGKVVCVPSLGYRDLPAGAAPFDWLLCNVPARIGPAAIGYLLARGRALLSPEGEVRVVVIRDLVAPTQAAADAHGLPLRLVASGPRHTVFALEAARDAAALPPGELAQVETAPPETAPEGRDALQDHEQIYARDETRFPRAAQTDLRLSRPHDISEDPRHAEALDVLLEALPRTLPARVLAFRCGYGALPLSLRLRTAGALIVAQDRDLLDTAFLRRNAAALGLAGDRLRVEETLLPLEAARDDERFGLVCGELSASAGPEVAARELKDAHALLAPGGEGLVLLSARQRREWLPAALPQGAAATVLVERPAGCVVRLSRPRLR